MLENLLVCQNLYKISLVLNEDKAFGYEKLFVHQSLYEMNLVRNADNASGYQKRFVYQYGHKFILVLNVCVQKTTCQASYVPKTC